MLPSKWALQMWEVWMPPSPAFNQFWQNTEEDPGFSLFLGASLLPAALPDPPKYHKPHSREEWVVSPAAELGVSIDRHQADPFLGVSLPPWL